MRILITGAYGFIGRAVVHALLNHSSTTPDTYSLSKKPAIEVIGAGRDISLGQHLLPEIEWLHCDFNHDLTPEAWFDRLQNIDVLINTVGILQSGPKDDAKRIHGQATIALFEAAQRVGLKKIIHISAITVDQNQNTAYATTKRQADQWLLANTTNAIILRPSLVVGANSFGGTVLLKGLSALPFLLPVPAPGSQKIQPIWLSDLADGIANMAVHDNQPKDQMSTEVIYACGPETYSITETLKAFRSWLGFGPAKVIKLPTWLLKPVFWIGDGLGHLGIKTALRSTSYTLLNDEDLQDPAPFAQRSEMHIRSLEEAFLANPANLQDRLFARSYFLWPAVQICLAFSWIILGLISFQAAINTQFWQDNAGLNLLLDPQFRAAFTGGVDVILGTLFLIPNWVRFAGTGKILLILFSLLITLFSAFAHLSLQDKILTFISQLGTIFMIALIMARYEKR